MTDETLEKYLKLFDDLNKAGRLWIPHHVALEFSAIHSTMNQNISKKDIQNFINLLEKSKNDIKNKLDELSKRNLKIIKDKTLSSLISNIDISINDINEFRKNKTHIQRNSNILNKILDIFTNIGGNFPVSDIDTLCKEAEARFSEKIPPGFNDDKKDSIGDFLSFNGKKYPTKYGDFFIWKQILNHVESFHSGIHSIILITDDNKSDWMDGRRARRELVEEVCNKGIKYFMIYNFDEFSKSAKKYLELNIDLSDLQDISNSEKIIQHKNQGIPWIRQGGNLYQISQSESKNSYFDSESAMVNQNIKSNIIHIDNQIELLKGVEQLDDEHLIVQGVEFIIYSIKGKLSQTMEFHHMVEKNMCIKIAHDLFNIRKEFEDTIDYLERTINLPNDSNKRLKDLLFMINKAFSLYLS